jgi:hypothetical protein
MTILECDSKVGRGWDRKGMRRRCCAMVAGLHHSTSSSAQPTIDTAENAVYFKSLAGGLLDNFRSKASCYSRHRLPVNGNEGTRVVPLDCE